MSDSKVINEIAEQMEQWARDFSTDEDHEVFLVWAQAVRRLQSQLVKRTEALKAAREYIEVEAAVEFKPAIRLIDEIDAALTDEIG